MSNLFLYAYNESSQGCKELANSLRSRRIRHERSNFVGSPNRVVVNWGSQTLPPEVLKCKIINRPEEISKYSNKARFFNNIHDVQIPKFTTSPDEAKKWVQDGMVVVARTVLNGHSGDGIQFMELSSPDSFVEAPLYVEYIKKKEEFRVHFVGKEIIDIQRKALRSDYNPDVVNWRVRNLASGFIYARNNIEVPSDVTRQANLLINQVGLDFGAIDVIYNEKSNKAYILEVNCAPGLVGQTLKKYSTAIKSLAEKM